MEVLSTMYGLTNVLIEEKGFKKVEFGEKDGKFYLADHLMSGKGATVTVERIVPSYIDENGEQIYRSELVLEECCGIAF
nr:hypothetical protein [uncultured Aminipila sp.]